MKEKGANQMACQQPEIGDLFPFYLNGDVTPEDAKKIKEHLAQCDACKKELLFWATLSEQGLPSWRQTRVQSGSPRHRKPPARKTLAR